MSKIDEFVRDLMPGRSEADIEEAKTNFQEYLLLVQEMSDRMERKEKNVGIDENDDFYVLDAKSNEKKVYED